mmetsp:Transcript_13294/g.33901  ORF Transcript_13294/g.33901 Transcript_13294/m.33901 type:complete len:228 (+) Transcript_13294:121-804(+)
MEAKLVPKGIKPATLKNVVKFTNDLKARDKILRLVQYYCKFLVYRLQASDPKSELAKRLNLLSKGISLHRKAFKFGAWVDEIQKFNELLESGKSDLKQTLSLILRPVMAMFVLLDNMIYLASLKVVLWDKDALKPKAYKVRLFAALLNTATGYLDIEKQVKLVKAASPEERSKAEEKQGQLLVGMVKNVADVVTYMNSAKYIEVNDGAIGLIGSASAAAALYTIWCK